jgi:hypothetical protein
MINIETTRYWVTEEGIVFRDKIKKVNPDITSKGYYRAHLSINGKVKKQFIHRLVAKSYIPNPNNLPFVNHINGNKTDNRVENLEWTNTTENNRLRIGFNKFTYQDIKDIRNSDMKQIRLSEKYNVGRGHISQIINKKIWA